MTGLLECVINISEGTNHDVIEALMAASGSSLLDVHCDPHHNRSVFTMAGSEVETDARSLAAAAVNLIDLNNHVGAHPRFGSVDVVPFVPLAETGASFADALLARDSFGQWVSSTLDVPCFFYGPERSLPEVRRRAFVDLQPHAGGSLPHSRNGACAVGARNYLIAYNLFMEDIAVTDARKIAKSLRSSSVRTLALVLGNAVQISCNLIDPLGVDGVRPDQIHDAVSAVASIERSELVGLLPAALLRQIPQSRWEALDLGEDKTIEARLNR